MVSEYALGHYGWVLALMFLSWGLSSWALAVATWSQVNTASGKVGLWFLVVAGTAPWLAFLKLLTTRGTVSRGYWESAVCPLRHCS